MVVCLRRWARCDPPDLAACPPEQRPLDGPDEVPIEALETHQRLAWPGQDSCKTHRAFGRANLALFSRRRASRDGSCSARNHPETFRAAKSRLPGAQRQGAGLVGSALCRTLRSWRCHSLANDLLRVLMVRYKKFDYPAAAGRREMRFGASSGSASSRI